MWFVALLLAATAAERAPDSEYTTEAMISILKRGRWFGEDSGVPSDFECAWRKAAFAQASVLQPELKLAQRGDLHDALELSSQCNQSFVSHSSETDARGGIRTEECRLVENCRSVTNVAEFLSALDLVGAATGSWEVRMAPGVYRLNKTLVLGPEQSGTSITAPSGGVTITGAKLLTVDWQLVTTAHGVKAYSAAVPAGITIDALRVGGQRATRARFPNANPETDQFPKGWVTGKTDSIPPVWAGDSKVVDKVLPGAYPGIGPKDQWGPYGFEGIYRVGVGGQCAKLTPPESYWCQPDGRVAGKTYFVRTPAGIEKAASHLPNAPYAGGAPNATVFYWRPGHWFTVMFDLAGPMSASGDLMFGRGGFQGAEGHDTVAEWYIENVYEELDAPNEFFHDVEGGRLLYIVNGSGAPPAQIEVPILNELVILNGSQSSPVERVSISGITFTGQRPTYLEPHGLPSGGDWGLERLGAIRLFGTESTSIVGCYFHTLDGNAVFLDGYTRNTTISGNEFVNLGASGIALWGYDDQGDGTSGDQPRFTTVTQNICHEIGIYQKQSSCFFQAVAAQSTITKNLFYNGPRAMVNFNDNFGGGHVLTDNLIFNTCRESSDHGAFNSWNRQPYLTKVGDGHTATAQPAYSTLGRNFIVANYAADGGCYDNDDGSSWYLEQDNFCVYGGMKSNFEGHNKRSTGNVHAFASVYGDHCLNGLNQINDFYADGYANNTCILAKAGDNYLGIGTQPGSTPCSVANLSAIHIQLGGNIVYAPNTSVTVTCGTPMSGDAWLAYGADTGTEFRDSSTLTSDAIVKMGLAAINKQA
eukprot:m.227837 g.227837  ORF g.227837 m.227837 type:complete len:815 (+) comp15667_c0_seq10:79-2523(+)